ncbi:DUF1659 domain-containing protein [Wansuia hejianensis]|uniref:DUF1659 domain-containing protein n=1 Tax=Wansuia hejianensis TaxID=2763667 RepID=A0A926ILF1_9FIRM|nr:DUF1659 domain-containing protein [Wansuia hejianensis]MBC8590069.1 DUF1659 domain-containing protein [Wansuia hejianensis]
MAIITVKEKTSLKLELDGGIVDGKQKIQSKSYNNVKTTAADEDLHSAAISLGGLYDKELLNVKKVEETSLTNE